MKAPAAALAVLACFALPARVSAELPLARLTAIFPPSGQAGSTMEIALTGQDLDDANRLYFAMPGISAKPKTSAAGTAEPAKFLVTIDAGVPPGLYDLRAVGRFGITNPRTLLVSTRPELIAKPGNTSASAAVELPAGSAIDALAEANAEQFFRLALKREQRVVLETWTIRLDSKMEAVLVLDDPSGRELARSRPDVPLAFQANADGDYLVRVHDVLYRGGAEYFYRLSATAGDHASADPAGSLRWPFPPAAAFLEPGSLPAEILGSEANQGQREARLIDPPCEIAGQFRAGHPREMYTFEAPAGAVYWIEVTSHRLGQTASAPLLVVQRITKDAQGKEQAADVQEVYETPAGGTPEFPTTTRDPFCRLEVKEAGKYRLLVRNLLQSAAEDRPVPYRLAVRKESPDFRLVAVPTSPLPNPKDSKDVPLWSTLLRRGGTTPITVVAGRCDGFGGAIRLEADGLPPGVTAGPSIIPAGASTGWVLLSADDDAVGWAGAIQIHGSAMIGDKQVTREALAGVISLSTYDTNTKLVVLRSRLADEIAMAVSETEGTPLTIALARATQESLEVAAGAKLSIPLRLAHSADFTTPIAFKLTGNPLLAATKEVSADPKADSVTLELDLGQIKLPPGQYTFYVEAQGKLKYQSKDVVASFYSPSFEVNVTVPAAKK